MNIFSVAQALTVAMLDVKPIIVDCSELAVQRRLVIQDSYVRCVRCESELFLGIEVSRSIDGIRCHVCGVTNLLGDIDRIRRARSVRIMQRRKSA